MRKMKKRYQFDKSKFFMPGQGAKQFRKGDMWRDPRINKGEAGAKDFIMIGNDHEADIEFLRDYLGNELENYPAEQYNMFTTGVDKNAGPLIGLHYIDENHDMTKCAIIVCRNGIEQAALEVVDEFCLPEGAKREWEVATRAEAVAKAAPSASVTPLKPLPASLHNFKKV